MKKYNADIVGYGWVAGRTSRPSTPLHWRGHVCLLFTPAGPGELTGKH